MEIYSSYVEIYSNFVKVKPSLFLSWFGETNWMTSKIHPIFPETLVQHVDLGIDQERLLKLYDLQSWHSTNSEDNAEYFLQISENFQVLDAVKDIKKVFLDLVNEYAKDLMLYENEFYMTTSWFTKTEYNKISSIHNHGNAVISAVYYFDLEGDEKSRITFERAFLSQFDLKPKSYNVFNSPTHFFELGNDAMLIFPSYLRHKANRNTNERVRKSLAMNFLPKGAIGDYLTEISLS